MFKIKIVIGDVEYDTGSLISNQPEDHSDWTMIGDIVNEFIRDKEETEVWDDDEEEEEGNNG